MSTYSERFPKYQVDVDAAQCDRSGVTPEVVLNTLGSYCGGAYIGNFNQFGKVYRIMAAASLSIASIRSRCKTSLFR